MNSPLKYYINICMSFCAFFITFISAIFASNVVLTVVIVMDIVTVYVFKCLNNTT